MNIKEAYLTPNPYSRAGRKMQTIKGIVIHWVGNPTSSAIANRNYFESLKEGKKNDKGQYIYASSHYIVGLEGEVVACVPEEEIAYHAQSANCSHIGIEVCHPDWNGKFSERTYQALITLILDICKRYKLNPLRDMIRHYDVTGKDCPLYYVRNPEAWTALKEDASQQLTTPRVQLIKIQVNEHIREVEGYVVDGNTFVKLRDLADEHIEVGYDPKQNLPIINVKAI